MAKKPVGRPVIVTDGHSFLIERRAKSPKSPWDIPRCPDIQETEMSQAVLELLGQTVGKGFLISTTVGSRLHSSGIVEYWGCRVDDEFDMAATCKPGDERKMIVEKLYPFRNQASKTSVLEAFCWSIANGETPIMFERSVV
ncbi:MAG: hypothetical protein WBO35_04890 [Candidatus Saccharimonadales bacterium]